MSATLGYLKARVSDIEVGGFTRLNGEKTESTAEVAVAAVVIAAPLNSLSRLEKPVPSPLSQPFSIATQFGGTKSSCRFALDLRRIYNRASGRMTVPAARVACHHL